MTFFTGSFGKRHRPTTKPKEAAPRASSAPVEDASDGGGEVQRDQLQRPAPTTQK